MAEITKKPWWTPAKRATAICLLTSAILACGLFFRLYNHPDQFEKLWQLYDKSLRGSIFSGFLSVAGFLLALHTFIVVKMREEVYDDEAYIKELGEEYKKNKLFSRYKPLQNLSGLLFSAILLSILTAASQLTIGLIKVNWVFCILCMLVISTIMVFVLSLVHVRSNIVKWMDLLTQKERLKKS